MKLVTFLLVLVLAPQATIRTFLEEQVARQSSKLIVAACNDELLNKEVKAKSLSQLAKQLGYVTKSSDAVIRIGPALKKSSDSSMVIELLQGDQDLLGKDLSMADLPVNSRAIIFEKLKNSASPELASQVDLNVRIDFSPYIVVTNSKGETVTRLFISHRRAGGGRAIGILLQVLQVETEESRFNTGQVYRLADILRLAGKEQVNLNDKFKGLPVVFFGRKPRLEEGLEQALRLYYFRIKGDSVVAMSYAEALEFKFPSWGITKFEFTLRDMTNSQKEELASLMREEGISLSEEFKYNYVPAISVRVESPSLRRSFTEYFSLR